MSKKQQVAVSRPQQVIPKAETDQLPATVTMFEEDAGKGFEAATSRDDFAIPFLVVLQPLSPQVDEADPEFIEGAKPGKILNTVTKQIYSSIKVVPVRYSRSFVEWVPRNKGGGFRGEHGMEMLQTFDELRDPKTGRAVLDNENELVDTRNFYVLVINDDDGSVAPAIISMSSTQIKKARVWLTVMNNTTLPGRDGTPYRPAMWAHLFQLSTVQQENDKGKWYGWRIERLGFVEDTEHYRMGQLFNNQVTQGTVKVDRSTLSDVEQDDDDL